MSNDCTDQQAKHKALLDEWYNNHYAHLENDVHEFTWDGPSDWNLWCTQKPKVLFLMKEARKEFQPGEPNQPITNKNGWNLARWYYAISTIYNNRQSIAFPYDNDLPETYAPFAIIEVKKLNEEKGTSIDKEINGYAEKDRELLKQQIELINPHVIVCCGTEDAYDIIYKDTPEIIDAEQLTIEDRYNCWNINNRLVIEFRHPATFPFRTTRLSSVDHKLFEIFVQRLVEGKVFERFDW